MKVQDITIYWNMCKKVEDILIQITAGVEI